MDQTKTNNSVILAIRWTLSQRYDNMLCWLWHKFAKYFSILILVLVLELKSHTLLHPLTFTHLMTSLVCLNVCPILISWSKILQQWTTLWSSRNTVRR